MRNYRPDEIEEMADNIKSKLKEGLNLTEACNTLGYSHNLPYSKKMKKHYDEFMKLRGSEVKPKKSPFAKEYKPIIKEDNYLV